MVIPTQADGSHQRCTVTCWPRGASICSLTQLPSGGCHRLLCPWRIRGLRCQPSIPSRCAYPRNACTRHWLSHVFICLWEGTLQGRILLLAWNQTHKMACIVIIEELLVDGGTAESIGLKQKHLVILCLCHLQYVNSPLVNFFPPTF